MITEKQMSEIVRLYRMQKHSIKQIMNLTGVRSEQTVYRVLDAYGVPRLKARKPVRRITIGLDSETESILKKANPKNVSKWVCEMVKKGYQLR